MNELSRITKDDLVKDSNIRYWALYAKSFYEDLFDKINNRNKLQDTYKEVLKKLKRSQDKAALTYFYRIKRDQLDGALSLENRMKKSELRQLIREEIQNVLQEELQSKLNERPLDLEYFADALIRQMHWPEVQKTSKKKALEFLRGLGLNVKDIVDVFEYAIKKYRIKIV